MNLVEAAEKALEELKELHALYSDPCPGVGNCPQARSIRDLEIAIGTEKMATKALKELMPFVMDDYYPACATPAFKVAVEFALYITRET